MALKTASTGRWPIFTHSRMMPAAILVCAVRILNGGFSQEREVWVLDPLQFPQLKNLTALRASSNNPDLNSNDVSKRPIPGETVVLADLQGLGIIRHTWLTMADSGYG